MSLTKATYSMVAGAPFNVVDYGASAAATTSDNKTALQAAISAANTAGGGSVIVPNNINYGYDRTDLATQPDFSATTTDILVIDYSAGNSYTSPAKDGMQVRYFFSTSDASVGNTDGNGYWVRGAWAPYLSISNDANLAAAGDPSRTALDNRRATLFFNNDGVGTWGIGQGTVSGASYTDDQLSAFKITCESYAGGSPAITNVMNIDKETGVWSFNSAFQTGVDWYYAGKRSATMITRKAAVATYGHSVQYYSGATERLTQSISGTDGSFSYNFSGGTARFKHGADGSLYKYSRYVSVQTASFAPNIADTAAVYTNTGDTGAQIVSLPTATVGAFFEFYVTEAFDVKLSPAVGDAFRGYTNGTALSTKAAGKYMNSSTVGSKCKLFCAVAGYWEFERYGTWADQP